MEIKKLKEIAKELRRDIIVTIGKAGSGHTGGSLSAVELLVGLYFYKMKYDSKNPKWADRDRFIMSKGHATPAMYSVLAKAGYFPKKELDSFRKFGSLLQGHVDIKVPGIEMSAGSLGMGLSFANGIEMAKRIDCKNYSVYVMLGDGEVQEGQIWESAMSASFHRLNVTAILDYNKVQQTGLVKDIMNIEPIAEKWKAFGWRVIEIDGHKIEEVVDALDKAAEIKDGPVIIIANTIKGKGVSFMEYNNKFHGKALTEEEQKKAIEEIERG